ncbi:serine/threonine-protein kinase [Pseudonocardia spinosispora]|uniref:serine/threonine-protein kinase n=1 Tax=Pseudonocardia spinosispora TaxID=103441 RepID=UPI00041AC8B1|nr:serine/threonine-protein kinase [Pseudonocardia spinosispora]
MTDPLRGTDPARVGPFRLLGVLGSGGMGRVYLGRDRAGRLAAVKVIHDGFAEDPGFRARFAREVDIARSVAAPWTAGVLDADPRADRPWLASEYVPGAVLEDAVRSDGPLSGERVTVLAARLAEALAGLHAAGVVHRDVKPSNVILAEDGPRLIDFGIARAVDATRITHTGKFAGTPGYMSPEQCGDGEIGTASDVFSLASVLTFAATGRGPFGDTGNAVAMLLRVIRDEPDVSAVPDALRAIVHRCLAKEPSDRPTAAELADELRTDATTLVSVEYGYSHTQHSRGEATEVIDHAAAPTQAVRTVVVAAPRSTGNRTLWITLACASVVAVLVAAVAWVGLPGGDGRLDTAAKISEAIDAQLQRDGTVKATMVSNSFAPENGTSTKVTAEFQARVEDEDTWFSQTVHTHTEWPARDGRPPGSANDGSESVLLPGHSWVRLLPSSITGKGTDWKDTPLDSTLPQDAAVIKGARGSAGVVNPLRHYLPAITLVRTEPDRLDGVAATKFTVSIDPAAIEQLDADPDWRPSGRPTPPNPDARTQTLWLDGDHRLLRTHSQQSPNSNTDMRYRDWGAPVQITSPR